MAMVTLGLLLAVVALIAWQHSVFEAYSRDFGRLSPTQFVDMNARMDALGRAARWVYVTLAVSDLVLIVSALRARALLALGLSCALAFVLLAFWLLSLASVSATMVG